jgi:predicted CXXCH cytochrome family protein
MLCAATTIVIAGSGGTAFAQADSETCITSSCHAKLGQEKYVHGPVAAGACLVCHGDAPKHKDNPKKHKFAKLNRVSDVCYQCHEQIQPRKMMHMPVKDGECAACHNPHASKNKYLLRAKGGELCFTCHDNELIRKRYVHGPAAVGGCIACHEPHSADYDKILKAEGPSLCYMCHSDKEEAVGKAGFVHTPVQKSCVKCHNPHSEDQQYMLKKKAPELCFGCHEGKKNQLASIKVKHGALSTGEKCLNCHDVHMSNVANNLLMEPLDLCLSCHNKEYPRKGGEGIVNMKKWLDENSNHHGPIKQKDCAGCHDPHGSANFRILVEPYPASFYAGFAPENYKLCFSCHEETVVLNEETDKLTNFRNGLQNLHFLHVNKPVKGRTCRACHETHASNFSKHIRESVSFGAWELPVNFEKTVTGGGCTPGCHKVMKYDRVNRELNQ